MAFGFGFGMPRSFAVPPFSPASLFSGGAPGAWYDPSDFNRYMDQLGPTLVTNGDLSDGTTGWTAVRSTLSASSGALVVTGSGTYPGVYQSFSTTAGKTYKVAIDVVSMGTSTTVRFAPKNGIGDGGTSLAVVDFTTTGSKSAVFTAIGGASTVFVLAEQNAVVNFSIDNISVKELTAISTATLYQDSAGTTPVTAVEQPVGLMLDKSQGLVLGSELVTNGDFSNGTTTGWTDASTAPGTFTAVSGAGVIAGNSTGAGRARQGVTTVAGRRYTLTFNFVSSVGARTCFNVGTTAGASDLLGNQTLNTGNYTFSVLATSTQLWINFFTQTSNDVLTIDNISVRELPGNHAFQSTSASRPVLSARYNLLTKTEQFDNAVWTKEGATITANSTTAPDGTQTADTLFETATTQRHRAYQLGSITSGSAVRATVSLKDLSCRYGVVVVSNSSAFLFYALVDLQTGTLLESQNFSGSSGYSGASVTSQESGWYRVLLTGTVADTSATLQVFTFNASTLGGNAALLNYAGDISKGLYTWGADLRVANNGTTQPAYQRVNTATDYNTVGFLPYLKFDGVDDSLSTNSISFTSTDKMSVFAGVRKLSDAASAIFVELSASASTNNGSFYVSAPESTSNYGVRARGATGTGGYNPTTFTAPITNVVAAQLDLSSATVAAAVIPRINGAVNQTNIANVLPGGGNFGNYPLYIGRRGGSSAPFNGQMYSMIIVGKAVTAGELSSTETYVNQKTGAY